jgi:hypothetical protein
MTFIADTHAPNQCRLKPAPSVHVKEILTYQIVNLLLALGLSAEKKPLMSEHENAVRTIRVLNEQFAPDGKPLQCYLKSFEGPSPAKQRSLFPGRNATL